MKSTFRMLFYIRKDKVKANGKTPINCRITIDGEFSQFSIKLDDRKTRLELAALSLGSVWIFDTSYSLIFPSNVNQLFQLSRRPGIFKTSRPNRIKKLFS